MGSVLRTEPTTYDYDESQGIREYFASDYGPSFLSIKFLDDFIESEHTNLLICIAGRPEQDGVCVPQSAVGWILVY